MSNLREQVKWGIDSAVTQLPCEDVTRNLLSKLTCFPTFSGHHAMLRIMARILDDNSNTIDVGANRGEVAKHFLRLAPHGEHELFEPQESLVHFLVQRFEGFDNVHIHHKAVGADQHTAEFTQYMKAPTLSTFFPRPELDDYSPNVVSVEVIALDDAALPSRIDAIKIDVEGSETEVLMGGKARLFNDQPYVFFEHNPAAVDASSSSTNEIIRIFREECNLAVYSLRGWLNGSAPLSNDEFVDRTKSGMENDFLAAHPESHKATPDRGQQCIQRRFSRR
jgi:FkbM family methyltransferase